MAEAAPRVLEPALVLPNDARWPMDRNAKRVEIDEFIADEPMTNLFLLALQDMMKSPLKASDDPEENWFSFYNLGAIHGFPNELWRNAPNTGRDASIGFYCAHSSNVFPTWHRLYIHMFEQAVFQHMKEVASRFKYDMHKVHEAALKRFRLPYWDPCLPRNKLADSAHIRDQWDVPMLLKSEEVWVKTPSGVDKKIPNPLLNFKYPTPEQHQESGRPVINWADESAGSDNIWKIKSTGHSVTLRSPDSKGNSSHDRFQQTLRYQYASLSVNLFQMLHSDSVGGDTPWDVFANNAAPTPGADDENASQETKDWLKLIGTAISLESWHDNVHGLVGSGETVGHMGSLSVAAFDPLFWLHHNNVDRIFALYQAMYPSKWVRDSSTNPNEFVAETPLSPFVKFQQGDEVKYYNSNDVRDWTGLGYAIPGDKHLTTKAGRDAVANYIREVYSWSADATRPRQTLSYPREVETFFALCGTDFDHERDVEFLAIEHDRVVQKVFDSWGIQKSETNLDVQFELPKLPDNYFSNPEKGEIYTWSVLMNVNKYALNSTFFVQVFIGKGEVPPDDAGSDYLKDPHIAGFSVVFSFSSEGDCENCNAQPDRTYGDAISITAKLREFLEGNEPAPGSTWPPASLRTLKSLDPEDVVPFLTKHLEWRLVTTDGKVLSAEEVKQSELKMLLVDSLYTYPLENNDAGPLGKYSPWHFHPDVTKDKDGGLSSSVTAAAAAVAAAS